MPERDRIASPIGTLPPPCRQDIAALCSAVREAIDRESPAPAVPASDFREVLLTGATGFVGRFLLRDLLERDPDLIVHCVVRARDEAAGMERLRAALGEAGIRQEELAPRIRVIPGDIREVRLGLDVRRHDDLCGRIDAVYHLAADLKLAASYRTLRGNNVFGVSHLLDLALRRRFKHFFHASTLGVFPQYFCCFSGEFSDSRIGDHDQPDPAEMKRLFPLGLVGYPWSKLVVEQTLLQARKAGLPVGIFRLPQSGKTSIGFAQPDDIQLRLFSAMIDVGMSPEVVSSMAFSDPIDVLARIMVSVSRNPDRRHVIHHCCEHEPVDPDLSLGDFGIHLRKVSYEAFRSACQARGEKSPLHAHWALLDHFSKYWFRKGRARTLPISARAIREDSPEPIRWPGVLARQTLFNDWIREHRDRWPWPLPKFRLDCDALVKRARQRAADQDLPFEEACSDTMLESLRRMVDALNDPCANLRDSRVGMAAYLLGNTLQRNIDLALERRENPEIGRERIVAPVFIVGIGRTGTTYLHRLLSRDPRFWTLSSRELAEPFPQRHCGSADPEDYSLNHFRDLIESTGVEKALEGVHRVEPDEPEEEVSIMQLSFRHWVSLLFCRKPPRYRRWLEKDDMSESYALHARAMQYFQHRRRSGGAVRSWLLKMPLHLMELDAIVANYPDAVFIQSHRDLAQVAGSWCSVVEKMHFLAGEPYPREEIGREQLELMNLMTDRAVAFRRAHPEFEDRWVDVSFVDLIEDPMAVVRYIHDQRGWALEPGAVTAMEEWLSHQSGQRRTGKRHRYSIGDYGLTRERLNETFASYRDFISERDLRRSIL